MNVGASFLPGVGLPVSGSYVPYRHVTDTVEYLVWDALPTVRLVERASAARAIRRSTRQSSMPRSLYSTSLATAA